MTRPSTTTQHIRLLHSNGKSEEEIIHIISEEWEIQDRIRIIHLIDYALRKQE